MKRILPVLIFVLILLMTLTACSGDDRPTGDTGTDTESAASGEASAADSAAPTDDSEPTTPPDPGTGPDTASDTEPATEPVTEPPVMDAAITFDGDTPVEKFVSAKTAEIELAEDAERGSVLKVTAGAGAPAVTVDLAAFAGAQGAVLSGEGRYVAVSFRVEKFKSTRLNLTSATTGKGRNVNLSVGGVVKPNSKSWQGIVYDLRATDTAGDALKKITLSYTGAKGGEILYVSGVTVTDDLNTALTAAGHAEYCLHTPDGLSDEDPLRDVVITAPDEEEGLLSWFDHITEKVGQATVRDTGRRGYTAYMAGNTIEDIQFFVSPDRDMTLRIEADPFTDGAGNTLAPEVFYEYYHNIENVMLPDALVPQKAGVEVRAGQSQAFVIKLRTAKDTPAGTYRSVIRVYDDSTGKEIRCAAAAVVVWGFALSDETEMRTAFAIWGDYLTKAYPSDWPTSSDVLYKNMYDFMLENRVCAMDLPYGASSSRGLPYVRDPRVNTIRVNDPNVMLEVEETDPDQLHKFFVYKVDEPATKEQLELVEQTAVDFGTVFPKFRMVAPFYADPNLTASHNITSGQDGVMDAIGYMAGSTKIFCPKYSAFTDRALTFYSGALFLQTEEQDKKYGVFADRMKKYTADGWELWAYICIDPVEPYANWQIRSDGVETIISLWQCKEFDITGLLYWAVDMYKVNYWGTKDPWTGTAYGDGILLYPGYGFRQDEPISTIRFEGIREGIEDYQMLCMLEDALGKDAADEMVAMVTTSMVTYTTDDDYLHAVRVLLGEKLNAALNP